MGMERSMFGAFIDKYFKPTVQKVTEYFNNKKSEPDYMFEQMLDSEYSADLTWNSTSLNHSIVAADVVSMDSSLPLKKRGTLRIASGDIAKIGIKYMLKEKAISDINVMKAKGNREAEIAAKILNNVPNAIKGIKVRLEIMFQQALSSGVVLINGDSNDGTGVRANFGYMDTHTFHATAAEWADYEEAAPLDDIRQMFAQADADSDSIEHIYLSRQYFDFMRKNYQVKELVATANNQVIISPDTLPVPGRAKTLEALRDEFGAEFHIVDSTFRYEKFDGTRETIKPWVQANVVGVPSMKVGRLIYGTLAEDMNRVAGVTYAKSDYILVSQYSHNEPSLAEFTAAQALAMPVIDDGQSVYVLHADATNASEFYVEQNALSFPAKGGAKSVNVHCDSTFTATSNNGDITVSVVGSTVKVRAKANSGASEYTGVVTLTDAQNNNKTINVTVAGAEGGEIPQ